MTHRPQAEDARWARLTWAGSFGVAEHLVDSLGDVGRVGRCPKQVRPGGVICWWCRGGSVVREAARSSPPGHVLGTSALSRIRASVCLLAARLASGLVDSRLVAPIVHSTLSGE